jgi:hypothetical protein
VLLAHLRDAVFVTNAVFAKLRTASTSIKPDSPGFRHGGISRNTLRHLLLENPKKIPKYFDQNWVAVANHAARPLCLPHNASRFRMPPVLRFSESPVLAQLVILLFD